MSTIFRTVQLKIKGLHLGAFFNLATSDSCSAYPPQVTSATA
ncbi:hypothetical protein VCHA39O220_150099 [Vibrio chagasii]|nr:hypothetical protein VCHA39O220_150099 [Vibrio chagasii]CAH7197098.1 hypothetical protein VCHA39O224_140099 [Vibrio chagasii]